MKRLTDTFAICREVGFSFDSWRFIVWCEDGDVLVSCPFPTHDLAKSEAEALLEEGNQCPSSLKN